MKCPLIIHIITTYGHKNWDTITCVRRFLKNIKDAKESVPKCWTN